jgi:hypothetical protein
LADTLHQLAQHAAQQDQYDDLRQENRFGCRARRRVSGKCRAGTADGAGQRPGEGKTTC